MKYLICLAFVGLAATASLPAQNYIQDTADVVAAKARFFQLYREQAALAEAAPDHDANHQQDFTAQSTFRSGSNNLPSQQQFSGAQVSVNSEGFVQNTADVQNAINEFNAAYQAQIAATRSSQAQTFQHQAAPVHHAVPSQQQFSRAQVTVNSEGFVQNTPEVQNAINEFNAAYQAQIAATRSSQAQTFQHQAAPVHHTAPVNQQAAFSQQHSGSFATFNADGSVQETPEVQAATSAFFDAYQRQQAATAAAQSFSNNVQSNSIPQQFAAQPFSNNVQSHSIPQQFAANPIHQTAPANQRWTGPVASTIPAGVEGALDQVAETAEIQAAKTEFLRAYKAQLAATGSFQGQASPAVYQEPNRQHHAAPVHQATPVHQQADFTHQQAAFTQQQAPVFRAAAVHNQQRQTSFQPAATVYRGQNDIVDPVAARSAHHDAFLQAIQTTGDISPEGQAAKTELLNAYQNILQLIS